MKIVFSGPALPTTGTLVVGVLAGGKLTPSAERLDRRTHGDLGRAIRAAAFKGEAQTCLPVMVPAGTRLDQVLLVGLGKPEALDELALEAAGGMIQANLATKTKAAAVAVDALAGAKLGTAEMAVHLALGARLRSYRFAKYRTKEKKADKPKLDELRLLVRDGAKARAAYVQLDKVADGVFFTRDLVSEPPNVLYPATLAAQARTLGRLGVKVEVLGVAEMKRLGMRALLGVGQGSVREPKLVVMRWRGAPRAHGETARPLAFIGKGVTFDTGGISIKPALNMHDMKWDMGGAGTVIGLMQSLAGRKARVNVVGVVGLVENMPDGNAQRPGDIVISMSGQTIEVLNTDAEGRLVLADALWYCKQRFKPRLTVDLATLTGAIIIALGHEMAGLFANDDELARRLITAGDKVGEKLWRMPLAKAYDKLIDSDVADVKNIGDRGAGSVTAAQFLQRFVGEGPWAHLDIAGVAWASKDSPTVPKGGTGFGVRLLDRLVADNYEGRR